MMKYEDSASFVYGIAKRARKYYLGLTTATQDVEDFLQTDYGKAVLSNSSIQILLKQGTTEVDLIQKTFYLSEGEKELLLTADVGEGLFFAGRNHVAIKVVAAPFEHELITSNPAEILAHQEQNAVAEQAAAQISLDNAQASFDTANQSLANIQGPQQPPVPAAQPAPQTQPIIQPQPPASPILPISPAPQPITSTSSQPTA